MQQASQTPNRMGQLKKGALLLLACAAAAGLSWVSSVERLPWTPDSAEAHSAIAPYRMPVLKQAGDQANVAFLQSRIAKQPNDFSDLAVLAGAYVHLARASNDPSWYLLAEQAARRSLANMKNNPAALIALCQIAQARHDFPEARRLADKIAVTHAIAVRPLRITIELATGQLDAAAKLADAAVEDYPNGGSHVQRALVREARGDDAGAISDYQWAIAREEAGYVENSVMARAWLGRLHARHGRLGLANDLYHEALRIAPGNGATLALLGATELRLGKADDAAAHFDQAVTLGQGAAAMMGLSRADSARGKTADAAHWLAEAERTLRRDLAAGGFGHRRDLAHLLLDKHEAAADKEALALMRQELALRQDLPSLVAMARAQGRLGLWAEADATLKRALATGAQDPELYAACAETARAQGQEASAKVYEATLRHIDPSFRSGPSVLPAIESVS
jgi:tetratricopeptide (TPR) repeat protein